jgi:hypothetical protein
VGNQETGKHVHPYLGWRQAILIINAQFRKSIDGRAIVSVQKLSALALTTQRAEEF